MRVKHTTIEGYTITTTYSVGLVYHEQVDEYDHDGNWLSSSTTMEGSEDANVSTLPGLRSIDEGTGRLKTREPSVSGRDDPIEGWLVKPPSI
jgi:hypothetical protein